MLLNLRHAALGGCNRCKILTQPGDGNFVLERGALCGAACLLDIALGCQKLLAVADLEKLEAVGSLAFGQSPIRFDPPLFLRVGRFHLGFPKFSLQLTLAVFFDKRHFPLARTIFLRARCIGALPTRGRHPERQSPSAQPIIEAGLPPTRGQGVPLREIVDRIVPDGILDKMAKRLRKP